MNDLEPIRFSEDEQAMAARLKAVGYEAFRPVAAVQPHSLRLHLQRALQDVAAGLNSQAHRRLDGQAVDCVAMLVDEAFPMALAAQAGAQSASMMSVGMARNLAVIASRLGVCLALIGQDGAREALPRDAVLSQLMLSQAYCSDQDLETALAGMVEPWAIGGAPIGAFAIFYDLVRMVWVHEWAHVLLGHVAFSQTLGMAELHEHSAARDQAACGGLGGHPVARVLQGFELHADQFAVKYCVRQILQGWDPVADMMGPHVNLVERLVAFNLACAVFAVFCSGAEDKTYRMDRASHPPAALRYMNFRDFQREICVQVDERLGIVDFHSYHLLGVAAELAPEFGAVLAITPLMQRTEQMQHLEQLSDFLMGLNQALSPHWRHFVYFPGGGT